MAKTRKVPQQRAIETRRRIVAAAYQVFARRGYGQATVDEIGNEAGVSMGALYHHFASKEELFRAILDEHMREEERELAVLFLPAASFRETLERFADFWLDHLRDKHSSDPLFMEFWAQATREPWAHEAVVAFFRWAVDLMREVLRLAQETGVVRRDLDVQAAATLLYAAMEGIAVLWAVDPKGTDLARLREPFVELMEGFLAADGQGELRDFQERLTSLFQQSPEPQADREA